MKHLTTNQLNNVLAVGICTAVMCGGAYAQAATGVDFSTAATDLKDKALAALAVIGIAILAVVAAVKAFHIGKSLFGGK